MIHDGTERDGEKRRGERGGRALSKLIIFHAFSRHPEHIGVARNFVWRGLRIFVPYGRRDRDAEGKGMGGSVPLLSQLGGLGELRELPSGVRGRAPAENEFWCM